MVTNRPTLLAPAVRVEWIRGLDGGCCAADAEGRTGSRSGPLRKLRWNSVGPVGGLLVLRIRFADVFHWIAGAADPVLRLLAS